MSKQKTITAEEFDRIFDEGKENITQYLDLENIRRPGRDPKRVNVDFPAWMVQAMDREADRIGITRQAFIKVIVAERLQALGRA